MKKCKKQIIILGLSNVKLYHLAQLQHTHTHTHPREHTHTHTRTQKNFYQKSKLWYNNFVRVLWIPFAPPLPTFFTFKKKTPVCQFHLHTHPLSCTRVLWTAPRLRALSLIHKLLRFHFILCYTRSLTLSLNAVTLIKKAPKPKFSEVT